MRSTRAGLRGPHLGRARPARPMPPRSPRPVPRPTVSFPPGYYYEPCQNNLNVDNYLTVRGEHDRQLQGPHPEHGQHQPDRADLRIHDPELGVTVAAPGTCSTLPTYSRPRPRRPVLTARSAAQCDLDQPGQCDRRRLRSRSRLLPWDRRAVWPTGGHERRGRRSRVVAGTASRERNLKASPYQLGGTGYGVKRHRQLPGGRPDARFGTPWLRRSPRSRTRRAGSG